MLSGSPFLFLIGVQGIKCSEMLLLKLGSNFILFYCGVLKYHFDWSSLPPQKFTSVQVLEPSVPEFVIGKIGFCAWKVYTLQPNNIQRPKREEGAVGTPSPTSASSRPNGDGLRPLLRSHSPPPRAPSSFVARRHGVAAATIFSSCRLPNIHSLVLGAGIRKLLRRRQMSPWPIPWLPTKGGRSGWCFQLTSPPSVFCASGTLLDSPLGR
jgi:hypothetical protein